MNASKCASLVTRVQPKTKKWVCDPTPAVSVMGAMISPMSVTDTYKYLGIYISAEGSVPEVEVKLKKDLRSLNRAPLKPQQRLWILNTKVIPAHFHQLVLSGGTLGFLRCLDLYIRAAVRQWTKLPKDTPIPFFYASAKDGGMGLTAFEFTIPAMKFKRLTNLTASQDPVVQKVVALPSFQRELQKWSRPVMFRGLLMSSPQLRRTAWAHELHASVDGHGLRHCSLVPHVHQWVTSGTSLMNGGKFNAALAVRAATLPTKLRASRGRPDADTSCDCCGPSRPERLSHILQECPRTHGARCARHNRVLAEAEKAFSKLGYSTLVEPHFQTSQGLRKPDLLIHAPGKQTAILDVSIVSDNYDDPDKPHRDKVNKYSSCPEITTAATTISGSVPIYSSIVINWRGAFSPQSAADLRSLGLKQHTIALLSAIAVEQGAVIHRQFMLSTYRAH